MFGLSNSGCSKVVEKKWTPTQELEQEALPSQKWTKN